MLQYTLPGAQRMHALAILWHMPFIRKIERRIRNRLSHHPKLYALIVGTGIILFWRGIWISADTIHAYIQHYQITSSVTFTIMPWWDGPLSIVVGIIILYSTGAFVSSFIGNELILSGLRGERRLTEQEEKDVQNEVHAIADIKDEIIILSQKMELLEKHVHKNHNSSGTPPTA